MNLQELQAKHPQIQITIDPNDIPDLPVGSMINAHWADNSQPDVVVVRIPYEGGSSTAGYSLLGGSHWLGVAKWGAELTVKYIPVGPS